MDELMLDLLLTLFIVAGALGLMLGTALLAAPGPLAVLLKYSNRWRSTRRSLRWLEVPIPVEKAVYRHHRLLGAGIVIGALFALGRLLPLAFQGSVAGSAPDPVFEIAIEAALAVLLMGNAGATVIGLIVLFRPSGLRRLENVANEWVSTRRALRPLEAMNTYLDRYVLLHPRAAGVLFVAGGLYLLATAVLMSG